MSENPKYNEWFSLVLNNESSNDISWADASWYAWVGCKNAVLALVENSGSLAELKSKIENEI